MKKLLITVNGKQYEVDVEVIEDDEESNHIYYNPPSTAPQPYPGANVQISGKAPKSKPIQQGDPKTLTSPINGIVLEIPVKEGQQVKENDILFVLEAMKMKTNISSPFSGVIESVKVSVNDNIESGQILLTFE
ncbi:MAG: glutaconyl-CoA/methylmalonyl-CoA decarboxylase subunit gamma [Bacteroidota bacterium]|nr:glutaconyl-CoA/methylmalonyl-CoA decarboxylase subunit gamma [Bacteroidota bacterium]